jgi:hypothetical protein
MWHPYGRAGICSKSLLSCWYYYIRSIPEVEEVLKYLIDRVL